MYGTVLQFFKLRPFARSNDDEDSSLTRFSTTLTDRKIFLSTSVFVRQKITDGSPKELDRTKYTVIYGRTWIKQRKIRIHSVTSGWCRRLKQIKNKTAKLFDDGRHFQHLIYSIRINASAQIMNAKIMFIHSIFNVSISESFFSTSHRCLPTATERGLFVRKLNRNPLIKSKQTKATLKMPDC